MAPILGALFAILIGLLSVPSLISWQNQAKNNVNAASIAQQARQVVLASSQYIQANAATLQATATASTPVTVSVAQLQAAGLLPEAFKATNLYNQTWQLQVLQPTAGNLQGLAITTGGEAISDVQAMQVAKLIGYEGGFFPKNDTGLYPGGANNAHGASWGPLSAAGYTRQAGHIALLINFNNGQLTDHRLYRNAVPGQPQLNTMTTPLIMASTQTQDAACGTKGAIAADSTGGLLVCQSSQWKSPGSAYWKDPVANYASLPATDPVGAVRMTVDTGRAYMWTGGGWAALAVDQDGNLTVPGTLSAAGGRVIAWNAVSEGGVLQLVGANGVSMYLENNNGTFRLINHPWNAQLLSVDQSGNLSTKGNVAADGALMPGLTVAENSSCAGYQEGAIARSANTSGLTLACQSATWKRTSKMTINYGACQYYGWGGFYGLCPVDHFIVGAVTRNSDSGEWNGFYCCPLN